MHRHSRRFLANGTRSTTHTRAGARIAALLLAFLAVLLVAAACGGGREDAVLPSETLAPSDSETAGAEQEAADSTTANDRIASESDGDPGGTPEGDGSGEPSTETSDPSEENQPVPNSTGTDDHADEEADGHEDDPTRTTDGDDGAVSPPGLSVYAAAGCAACHGDNAEGTDIGPSLPGHSAEVIARQIRAPLGSMPAYGANRLSDADVDLIVEYITSLAPPAEHVEPLDLPGQLAVHHWMALIAIDAGDPDDALHHVEHIADTAQGDHRRAMQQAAELLRADQVGLAEDTIQDMLAGTAEPDLTLEDLHLQLALSAIDATDFEQAIHHLEDAVDVSRGPRRRATNEALELLREDAVHDAQHALQAMLDVEHG